MWCIIIAAASVFVPAAAATFALALSAKRGDDWRVL